MIILKRPERMAEEKESKVKCKCYEGKKMRQDLVVDLILSWE